MQEGVPKHAHVLDFSRVHDEELCKGIAEHPSCRIDGFLCLWWGGWCLFTLLHGVGGVAVEQTHDGLAAAAARTRKTVLCSMGLRFLPSLLLDLARCDACVVCDPYIRTDEGNTKKNPNRNPIGTTLLILHFLALGGTSGGKQHCWQYQSQDV